MTWSKFIYPKSTRSFLPLYVIAGNIYICYLVLTGKLLISMISKNRQGSHDSPCSQQSIVTCILIFILPHKLCLLTFIFSLEVIDLLFSYIGTSACELLHGLDRSLVRMTTLDLSSVMLIIFWCVVCGLGRSFFFFVLFLSIYWLMIYYISRSYLRFEAQGEFTGPNDMSCIICGLGRSFFFSSLFKSIYWLMIYYIFRSYLRFEARGVWWAQTMPDVSFVA